MTTLFEINTTSFSFSDSLSSVGCQDIQVIWNQQAILSSFTQQLLGRTILMLYFIILLVLYYRWTRKNEGHLLKTIAIETAEIFTILWVVVLLGSISKTHYVVVVFIALGFELVRRITKKTGPVKFL